MKLHELMRVLEHEARHFAARGIDPSEVDVVVARKSTEGFADLAITEATVSEGHECDRFGTLLLRGTE